MIVGFLIHPNSHMNYGLTVIDEILTLMLEPAVPPQPRLGVIEIGPVLKSALALANGLIIDATILQMFGLVQSVFI